MQTTVALGLVTALDVTTARRLYDYGELDDAGVASALEQTGLQRSEAGARPGYLRRVQHVAVVIDSPDGMSLAAFEAGDLDEECAMLASLFALLPETAGRAVSWDTGDWDLLLQRACMHELRAPATAHRWPRQSLCRLFGEQSAGYDIQADAVKLLGGHAASLHGIDPALRAAVNWHDMDLRWRCVRGEIDFGTRRDRLARVRAQIDRSRATVHEDHS